MRLGNELDRVVAVGTITNSSEPTGIFQTSGVTTVLPTFPVTGPLMVTDAETLAWGINKVYRGSVWNPSYIASDTTYRRFRSVPVGTDDSRRVFGMDPANYMLFDWPFKINNNIPDGYVGFAALKMYRMYRREGTEVRYSEEGKTLMLANSALLFVRPLWRPVVRSHSGGCDDQRFNDWLKNSRAGPPSQRPFGSPPSSGGWPALLTPSSTNEDES